MAALAIFRDAFFDGFTMAGFLDHLGQPGGPMPLFASPGENPECVALTLQRTREGWSFSGDLRSVPEQALRVMMDRLRVEQEGRRTTDTVAERAVHGTPR